MNKTVIEIENLTKLYPSKKGIKDINISTPQNAITMIEGANGSGKTTLLKTISGILKADKGKIKCFNKDITNDYQKTVKYISILTDTRSIYWRLTLKENIEFIAGLQGISPRKSLLYTQKYIGIFGIEEYINKQIRFLSDGNKEKAAIICTIARMTPVIIFDEPAVNLDKESIILLKEIMKTLSKEKTVIFSSHNESLKEIADKTIYIKNGKVEASL